MPSYQSTQEANPYVFPMPSYWEPWAQLARHEIASGAVDSLPWHDARVKGGDFRPVGGHYARVSPDNAGMIAFTPTAKMGREGRRSEMKPGRYLRKYYPRLKDQQIERLASEWKARFVVGLHFADTPEDIREVYEYGPHSCMSDVEVDGHHPVEVYGAGDLAVAYISDASSGRTTARCIVYPAKKVRACSVYGDATTLRAALDNAGYRETTNGAFRGAKLLRIDTDMGILCPYLDVEGSVTVTPDALYLGHCADDHETGAYSEDAQSEHGILGGYDEFTCRECGEAVDGDYACYHGDESYCECCFGDLFGNCSGCYESTPHDELVSAGCSDYCEYCRDEHLICCDSCSEWETTDDAVIDRDGACYCDSCAATETGNCGTCYETVSMEQIDDVSAADLQCTDCADDSADDLEEDD